MAIKTTSRVNKVKK